MMVSLHQRFVFTTTDEAPSLRRIEKDKAPIYEVKNIRNHQNLEGGLQGNLDSERELKEILQVAEETGTARILAIPKVATSIVPNYQSNLLNKSTHFSRT